MSPWLVVVLAGAGSYLLRISMLVVSARFRLPAVVDRAAPFAVPAAFAALAASALTRHTREVGLDALPALVAVAAGVVVARRTGNGQAALLAGLPVMWLLSALPL
jgi:branched chain amino acid efflux pump